MPKEAFDVKNYYRRRIFKTTISTSEEKICFRLGEGREKELF